MRLNVACAFGTLLLLCIITLSNGSKKCYHAKTCIHNANEKCGIDSDGNLRRFLDSCDMKEFNCLRDTNYEKTANEKCSHLPPIPPEKNERK